MAGEGEAVGLVLKFVRGDTGVGRAGVRVGVAARPLLLFLPAEALPLLSCGSAVSLLELAEVLSG